MKFFLYLLSVCAMLGYPGIAFSVRDVFTIEQGLQIEASGVKVKYLVGSLNPSSFPGVSAPLASQYHRSNGEIFIKYGSLDTEWSLAGLESNVVTQSADFGKNGNSPSGTWLERSGSVPSNIAGISSLLSMASIRSLACSQEDTATWSVEFYEHSGNLTNLILLDTLSVITSNTGSKSNLSISITTGKQLAVKATTAVKNIGCTIVVKGLAQ